MSKRNNDRGGITVHRPKSKADFQRLSNELSRRGFVAIDVLKPGRVHSLTIGDRDASGTQAQDMATCIGNGSVSNGPLTKVAWAFDSRESAVQQVADKDGTPLGRGYVKWGASDNLPAVIYSLAKASPYTAAPLRYLSDLSTGLGVRMMYQFEDETMCEYRNAGATILQRLGNAVNEEQKDYWKKAYHEWSRTWNGEEATYSDGTKRHIPGLREFLENNNLDLHLQQCMHDDQMFDLYFPTVGFERGRRGTWDPRIVRVDMLKIIDGIRYEVMNEYRHIQNVYYGERFRAKGINEVRTLGGEQQPLTMYRVAEQQCRTAELRYIVESNQRTRIKDRPTWVVCPVSYGQKNYYQQPDWWSIFTSKAYDFSSTILYDKAKQRENNTSWGRIMYISLDYLNQVFADEGYQGDKEKQQEFIDQLDQSMEQFLQHRDNHGKMMRQFMWTGPDGKEHKNVEIVDITDAVNNEAKAGKEELELSTNPIFLAFGVDPRDVGVPMVSASNGGTALREIRLMKMQLLNVRQRAYCRFLEDVCAFNYWAKAVPVIKQMTFSTLDRSSTGMIETIAGQGA